MTKVGNSCFTSADLHYWQRLLGEEKSNHGPPGSYTLTLINRENCVARNHEEGQTGQDNNRCVMDRTINTIPVCAGYSPEFCAKKSNSSFTSTPKRKLT